MKKSMKNLISITCLMMMLVPVFAAKKTADDWKAEIEAVAPDMEWEFEESVTKGKVFKGKVLYCIDETSSGAKVVPVNPLASHDNVMNFAMINNPDAAFKDTVDTFGALNKGDIFFTIDGKNFKGKANLWILSKKTKFANAITVNNGSISVNTNVGNTVMKYRGWGIKSSVSGEVVEKSKAGISSYQGATLNNMGTSFYSVTRPEKGVLLIMITDIQTKEIYEYELQYLGSTCSFK